MTRSLLISATLAGGLLLTGCSGISGGEAAVIEGRSISEADLQEASGQLDTLIPDTADPRALIGDLARSVIFDEVMRGTPLELTDREVVDLLGAEGITEPNDVVVDVVRTREYLAMLQDPAVAADPANEVVVQRLGEVQQEQLDALQVEVNPRYGSWDVEQLTVLEQAPEWITPAG